MDTRQKLVREMCRTMMRVQNKGSRLSKMPVTMENGMILTPREAHAIRELGLDPELTVTGLSELFGVTGSAASQLVSKLEKRGFVTKSVSVRNSKERTLELTPLGREAFEGHSRGYKKNMADIEQRMGALSPDQIAAASVVLEVFEDVFDHRLDKLG